MEPPNLTRLRLDPSGVCFVESVRSTVPQYWPPPTLQLQALGFGAEQDAVGLFKSLYDLGVDAFDQRFI